MLAWLQGGETVWIDQNGSAFAVRGEISDLLPIVVDDAHTDLAARSQSAAGCDSRGRWS